jgi:hypothetical protein
MRTVLTALAVFVMGGLGGAAAQPLQSFTLQDSAYLTETVEYHGEGWRNLRALEFVQDGYPNDIRFSAYWACGADALIMASVREVFGANPRDLEIFRGIEPGSTQLFVGRTVDATPTGFDGGFPFSAVDAQRFTRWANWLCTAPPPTTVEPDDIMLSVSQTEVYHLLSERFATRQGLLRFWARRDSLSTVDSEIDLAGEWAPWVTTIIDEDSGFSLGEYEIDCSSYEYRILSEVTYNSTGDVVSQIPRQFGSFSVIVLGSVGESILETVCLIR